MRGPVVAREVSMLRRAVNGILDAQGWADGLGEFLQKAYLAVLRPMPIVKDLLHGTWLGHALHPAITDIPIGALTAALFLDVVGLVESAKWVMVLGYAGLIASALTGIADYTGTSGRARRYGTIHSLLMVVSTVLYLLSLLMRFEVIAGTYQTAMIVAIAGYVLLVLGAYLGGEIVFGLGYMVDRHAWRPAGAKWTAVEPSEFPENAPAKAKAGAQALVVVRRGDALFALHDVCAHAGCSLSDKGTVVGDKLECQCHGSRFDLATGRVARGPATFDQPAFDIRRGEGGALEARRRPT